MSLDFDEAFETDQRRGHINELTTVGFFSGWLDWDALTKQQRDSLATFTWATWYLGPVVSRDSPKSNLIFNCIETMKNYTVLNVNLLTYHTCV
jgi:hypothetical protein